MIQLKLDLTVNTAVKIEEESINQSFCLCFASKIDWHRFYYWCVKIFVKLKI